MVGVSGLHNGGYDRNSIPHALFDAIDASGNGSIDKGELAKAVTAAGGTSAAANALYGRLDPARTGSVAEQQFAQSLPPSPFSDGIGAQLIAFQAGAWAGGVSSSQAARNLFSQIDTGGSGAITKADLETAVTRAGGTKAAADALYARLDPGNAGSVSAQQFISLLSQARPHRHHHHGQAGNNGVDSAQDALSALLDSLFPPDGGVTSTASGSSGSRATATTGVAAIPGQTAADALWALLTDSGSLASATQSRTSTFAGTSANFMQSALLALASGNYSLFGSATLDPLSSLMGFGRRGLGSGGSMFNAWGAGGQAALLTLVQATGNASSTGLGGWPSSLYGGLDMPSAIMLYQHQLNQQMFDAMFPKT